MQVKEERLPRGGVAPDPLHGAIAEQVGAIALLRDSAVLLPQIRDVHAGGVPIIIQRAAAKAEEMVVSALVRTEERQRAKVPFADQRRAVTSLAQQRRQCRMLGWQADPPLGAGRDRLLPAHREPDLVAAGDDRDA